MVWHLNVDNFTIFDRLKIAAFILNRNNRLTMGSQVAKFEKEFARFAGVPFAIFTSSGSTANSLLAETLKSIHGNSQTVVVPATTWSTSINPWLQAGYPVVFSDVNLDDFSFDLDKLAVTLAYTNNAIVFATSLLGFVPNLDALRLVCEKYGAKLYLDNCENTLGKYKDESILSYATGTTSTYFGHQICSIEGGFLFTKDPQIHERALMIRNHGMTRSLSENNLTRSKFEQANPSIDPQFLFAEVGNNFRNTEINALFGSLDFRRREEYAKTRRDLYTFFLQELNEQFYAPDILSDDCYHVPFCLPIVCNDRDCLPGLKQRLKDAQIEYRPIVGGHLPSQPIYQKTVPRIAEVDTTNSRTLHNRGLYVGLHNKVSFSDIKRLCSVINE